MTAARLTIRDGPFVMLIVTLAFMLATLHHNILGGRSQVVPGVHNVARVVLQQLEIVDGQYSNSDSPDVQTRILVPLVYYTIYHLSPWRWEAPTFLLGDWLTTVVSLLALFYLAKKVSGDPVAALAAVVLMALYVPFAFSSPFRAGETLIFGFYCAIAWAVLADARVLFLLLIALASLQRPDMSASGAGFGVLYWLWERRDFRPSTLALCAAGIALPFMGAFSVTHYYHVTDFTELTDLLAVKWMWNVKDSRIIVLMVLPLVASIRIFKVRFERIVWVMIASLVPWLVFCIFFCNFSEPRHFFQVIAVVIIGITQSISGSLRQAAAPVAPAS